MNLEPVIHSEVSQKKTKYHIVEFRNLEWNGMEFRMEFRKMGLMSLLAGQE